MEVLKREYQQVFRFFASFKKYIIFSFVFFVAVAISAYFVSMAVYADDPEAIDQYLSGFDEMIENKSIFDAQGNISFPALFFNNFTAAMHAVSMGLLPYLFMPLFSSIVNAGSVGVMMGIMHSLELGGIWEMIVTVAPHGIFEIPALVLSVAFGIKLCSDVTAVISAKKERGAVAETLGELARALVLTVVPMLLAAAYIETYITPLCIEHFIK